MLMAAVRRFIGSLVGSILKVLRNLRFI